MIAISNPVSASAIFLSLTEQLSVKERIKIGALCAIYVLIVLIFVVWFGKGMLSILGISIDSFQVAGAVIIILMGIAMISGKDSGTPASHTGMKYSQMEHDEAKIKVNSSKILSSIAIIPLTIPLTAGPGAISTVIIYAHDFSSSGIFKSKLILSGLVLLVAFVIGITMWLSALFSKFISNSGVNIIARIIGLILTAIGFNMFGAGLLRMFPGLG